MEKDAVLIKKKARAKREGNTLQLAEAAKNLGDHYFRSENFVKALEEYLQAVKAYEILDDKLKFAEVHRIIGETNCALGKFESALQHLKLHLEKAEELEHVVEQQRGLATFGRTYFLLAHTFPEQSEGRVNAFENARKFYNRSIRICEKLEGTIPKAELMTMRARLLLNQGLVQEALLEPELGINLIKSAIEICTANKFHDELHRTYIAVGALYQKQGDIDLALETLDLAARTEHKSRKAQALLAKAELFLEIGQWLNARKVLVALYPDKSLSQSIRKKLEKLLRIAVSLCRGEEKLRAGDTEFSKLKLYEDLGDGAAAAHCHDKAIQFYKKMHFHAMKDGSNAKIAAALVSLAQTLKDAGRYEEALPFARRELEMCSDPQEACGSALLLAELLESAGSASSEIVHMYKEALSKAKISEKPSLEATVLKKYLHYLENHQLEVKTKLNLLLEQATDVESEKEFPNSQDIGADISLDQLSDMDYSDTEKKRVKLSRPRSTSSGRKGLQVRKNYKGETQLHVACIKGNIEKVQKLLDEGHPTDVRDNAGWTPLHEAANHGFVEVAKRLITAGADVNDPGSPTGEGITPLHDAAGNGQFPMMHLLIKKGADVYARTRKGESIIDCLEEWRSRVKILPDKTKTGYEHVRRKLISQGVTRSKTIRSTVN